MVSTQKVCNELKMVLQFTFSQINWFPNEQFSELKCFANAERYVYFFYGSHFVSEFSADILKAFNSVNLHKGLLML